MTTTPQQNGTYPLTREEEITLKTYNTIAPRWDRDFTRRRYKANHWDAFTYEMPGGASILDLGCGTAHPTASWVIEQGYRYTGIDISENMLAVARKNLEGKPFITDESLRNMDMRSLTFEAETFHGFICFTSFMHLPRQTLSIALSEARRVLKPQGKGIISISQGDFEGLWTPCEVSLQAYTACWWPEELYAVFKQTGFSICFEEDLQDVLVYVIQKT